MRINRFCGVALALAGLTAVACDTASPDIEEGDPILEESFEFRGGPYPMPPLPWNGDLSIHLGQSTASPDCDLWDILDIVVVDGPASPAPLHWELVGNQIRNDNGQVECTLVQNFGNYIEVVEGTNGPVVLSIFNIWAFDRDLGGLSYSEILQSLRYTFRDDQVREGGWWGPPLVTATETIMFSHLKRKAVIAALVDGQCGSPGLPMPSAPPQP